MLTHLRLVYAFLVGSSLLSVTYSYLSPGISSPVHSPMNMSSILKKLNLPSLVSTSAININENTSDRKFSKLYRYSFNNGSNLTSVMVRVRKRDDFKIETYGLLTKGIDSLYIESPTIHSSPPISMIGRISGKPAIQTCLVPGTSQLDQANVQLDPLTSLAENHSGQRSSFRAKLLGFETYTDYSCLVLTYFPSLTEQKSQSYIQIWSKLVTLAQSSFLKTVAAPPS